MKNVFDDMLKLVGNTPIVRLNKISGKECGNIYAKIEHFNPGGSVKDRIALNMILEAQRQGKLAEESIIIEPTSGNTGIGLAMVCAVLGYRLILTMPDTMSMERRNLLKAYGAELVLTPGELGMNGAIEKAKALAVEFPGSFIPQQFENEANPDIHRETTAREIWRDMAGDIDIFVAGIGTGGTITGVGEQLKKYRSSIKIVGVEPEASAVVAGGEPGKHGIQGIGAGFIPKVLNKNIIDELISVKDSDAIDMTRNLATKEGLLVGISSGAAVYASTLIANRKENRDKNILVLLPDTGQRYLSMPVFSEK
ncbi:MAG: cysteine synthase A [Clostridiales bacterium]|nr:cysteine synthase A [Clostridiales bacterium]